METRGRYPDLARKQGSANNVFAMPVGARDAVSQETDKDESVLVDEVASMRPDYLGEEEVVIWDRVCLLLLKEKRMKDLYVDLLAQYCVTLARIKRMQKYLDVNDWEYITEGRNGIQRKLRPYAAQVNVDHRSLLSLAARFGLSPGDELRYNAGRQGDMFDEFGDID